MTARSDHDEDTKVNPIHIDHKLEKVGRNVSHSWTQKGVEMICDGNHDHFRHGFVIEPELVFMDEIDNGLRFRNVKTGKEVIREFHSTC